MDVSPNCKETERRNSKESSKPPAHEPARTHAPAEIVYDEKSKGAFFCKSAKEFTAKAVNFSGSFFLKNLL